MRLSCIRSRRGVPGVAKAALVALHPGHLAAGPSSLFLCSVARSTGYSDNITRISYEADINYIWTGSTAVVGTKFMFNSSDGYYLNTLRYFPPGTTPRKNCYSLTVHNNTQYLVRAIFFHGGYNSQPDGFVSFQLALDASLWTATSVGAASRFYFVEEAIVMTKKASLSVCLIRTSDAINGVPFINSLELRPLPNTMYLGRYTSPDPSNYLLNKLVRHDFGESILQTRYPDDPYDRLWSAYDSKSLGYSDDAATAKSLSFTPASSTFVDDEPPNSVLRTAITDLNATSINLNFTLNLDNTVSEVYINVFFAEIRSTAELEGRSRILDVSGNFLDSPISGLEISATPFTSVRVGADSASAAGGNINLQVKKNINSYLPPIVNALELYSKPDVSLGTLAAQAANLDDIKDQLGRNVWSGDPCLPAPWLGLNCIGDQVTSIDLSNQSLTGVIPDFSNLTSLISLDLSNNIFSGNLPGWVTALPSLKTLDVSKNQLNGTFPSSYTRRIPGFRYSNNLQLKCVPTDGVPCPATKSKKISLGPIIGAVVGGIALIVASVLLYCWYKRRRESNVKIPRAQSPVMSTPLADSSATETSFHVDAMRGKAKPFTLQSIKEATDNFAWKIGEGGFGPVYYGMFKPQQEVAVKVMSEKTCQGFSEFSNEIDLLSTVHYKKLVSLVGYCQEGSDLILLYEYMSGGDLAQRLHGKKASHSPLNWRQRLQIAVDAARGLEYLHNGCSPAIFHRDVKSNNILLTEKLDAKVADFGLSKLTDLDQVLTQVKGTVGYLDPDYSATGMVTDKSDVYSFGVVLMELLLGQPPIVKEGSYNKLINIVEKVRAAMSAGSLQAVIDPKLGGEYRAESAWKVAEVALNCVARSRASRPGMKQVAAELDQVLEKEFGGQENSRQDGVGGDSDVFTSNSSSGPAPSNYNKSSNGGASHSDTSSLAPEVPSQTFY